MEEIYYSDYTAEFVSNSGLGKLDRILKGLPAELNIKPETLANGRFFHSAALTPGAYDMEADGNAANHRNMVYALNQHPGYAYMRKHAEAKLEHEHYWTCQFTGVRCKGKFDIELFSTFADLKGTSCKTREEFIQTIFMYDYDRQGAFYLDGGKGKKFTFYGVQKKYPHNVFTYEMDAMSEEIIAGREKYIYLIREGIARGWFKTKFQSNAQ